MINYHVDIVDIKGKRTILLLQKSNNILCSMIFFHGNLVEFLTSCLWNFCPIYGILAFSNGNSRFESGSPAYYDDSMCSRLLGYCDKYKETLKQCIFKFLRTIFNNEQFNCIEN